MTTRCKFICMSVTKRWDAYGKRFTFDATMSAVSSGSEENKKFWAASPGGTFNVSTLRDDTFTAGTEYYFDITEAPCADS